MRQGSGARTVRNYRFYPTKLRRVCFTAEVSFVIFVTSRSLDTSFSATKFYYSLLDIYRHALPNNHKLIQFLSINLCGSEFKLQVLVWRLNWKCLIFFIASAFSFTSSLSSSGRIGRSEVDSELYILSSYFHLSARLSVIRFLSP